MHVSLKVLLGVSRKNGEVVYEQPGEVVDVEDDFGKEMILNGWAEAVEEEAEAEADYQPPPPPPPPEAKRGRHSTK